MAPTIHRATVDDLDGLTPLFDGYRQFYLQPSSPDRARAFLAERMERDESVIFAARLEAPRLIGFTQLYPTFSSILGGRCWILGDLFVAPEARSHGVGRALLERARRFGVETSADYLELTTAVTNETAQRLYESLGWRRDREYYHYELSLDG